MKAKLCVIEDSSDLQALIRHELGQWYDLTPALNLNDAWTLLSSERFDLVLLDVSLPDGSGLEFCARIKNAPDTRDLPVIFLTGRSTPLDKMMGFSLGAEDYLAKPFEPIEARARIEARLARQKALGKTENSQRIGTLLFDRLKGKVFVEEDGNERDLGLTPFEFKLLYFLASNQGQVFNRTELMRNILSSDVHVGEQTIYTHISALRRKLASYADCVECLPRVGYRFVSAATRTR